VSTGDWRLLEPMVYHGARESWTIPAGFVSDFASVPRAFVWLIPTYGDYTPAALLHDWFWELDRAGASPISIADADGLFRRCLREAGVSWPKRWAMWAAVRAGSFMRGASAADWVRWIVVVVPAVAFLAIPAAVVQLWIVAAWLVELVSWSVLRLFGRRRPRPIFEQTL